MIVVLDTNVILAALATRGLCEALMSVCLAKHEVALSEAILTEVAKHLSGKFKMPAAQVRERVDFLREHFTLVKPSPVDAGACRDPKDLPILGTAVAAGAACLVTGDDDLLLLGEYKGVSIIRPRAFYDRLR